MQLENLSIIQRNRMNISLIHCIGLAAALCSTIAAQDKAKPAATGLPTNLELANILKDLHAANPLLPVQQDIADLKCNDTFTQEELLALSELALKKTTEFDELEETPAYAQLQVFMDNTLSQLKDYKVTGVGFAKHTAYSLFYGKQNFNTNFLLKNSTGKVSTRTFNIDYSSIGLQSTCGYRLDAIFTIGADLNRHTTNTPLKFGVGFTGSWQTPIPSIPVNQLGFVHFETYAPISLGFTVLPFKNTAGYMVIAHMGISPVGFTCFNQRANPFSRYAFNAALVLSGGSFTSQAQN